MHSILPLKIFTSRPGSRLRFFINANSVLLLLIAHLCTAVESYAQNPVFEIVHDESVKVCLHIMYNGNVQQNPLCVESCVTTEFPFLPGSRQRLMIPITADYAN